MDDQAIWTPMSGARVPSAGQEPLIGKVAIVIGGATAAGQASAIELARSGAAVILAVPDGEQQPLLSQLDQTGQTMHALVCDPSLIEGWNMLVAEALDQFGSLDIVIDASQHASPAALTAVIERAIVQMKPDGGAGKGGSIIGVLTNEASECVVGHLDVVRSMASDSAQAGFGVRVNLVRAVGEMRIGDELARDVGKAVTYLSTDHARRVSGQELRIEAAVAM